MQPRHDFLFIKSPICLPVCLCAAQAYTNAVEVLTAVSNKLRASSGDYLFGSQPSSTDALLFGHLAFYLYSPCVAPVLKSKVLT